MSLHKKGKPSRFLADNIGLFPGGRVPDIAMGEERNAVFLACMDFEVDGIDISPKAFIIDQAQFGRPSNPDYLLKHNELLDMFRDYGCLRYHEGLLEDKKAAAGIIAEKPEP
jgi:hypothetical protein